MSYTAMILAAGRGERMRPLTDATPKPLLQVGGKALIEWQIERLRDAGFRRIVINHAWLGAQIEERLGDGRRYGVGIVYSPEAQALETAGGIARALPLLGGEPFAVVSGDIYTEYDYRVLARVIDELRQPGCGRTAHLVMVDNPPFHPRGDFALAQGLLAIADSGRLTFGNLSCFVPSFFDPVPPGARMKLVDLLLPAIAQHKVSGEHFSGAWFNVGTPDELATVDRHVRQSPAGGAG